MPYMDKKYIKWLVGKTIKKVVVYDIRGLQLVFSDGSRIVFDAHVQHMCRCKESIIVNKSEGIK